MSAPATSTGATAPAPVIVPTLLEREPTLFAPAVTWIRGNLENGSLLTKAFTYALGFFAITATAACMYAIPMSAYIIVPLVIIFAMEYSEQSQDAIAQHNLGIIQGQHTSALATVQTALTQKTAEYNQLSSEYTSIETESETRGKKVFSLAQEKAAAESLVASKQTAIEHLTTQLKEFDAIKQAKAAAEQKLREASDKIIDIEPKLSEALKKVAENDINNQQAIEDGVAAAKAPFEQKITQLTQEKAALQDQLQDLETNLANEDEVVKFPKVAELKTALELQIQEKTLALQTATQQLARQKEELEAAKATVDDLKPKLEQATNQVQEHLATIQAMTQLIDAAGGEDELKGIKEKIARFEEQITTLKETSQQQEEASTKKLQELTEAHATALEEKVQELEVATKSVEELKTKLLASQQETTEATEQGKKAVELIQQQLTLKKEEVAKKLGELKQTHTEALDEKVQALEAATQSVEKLKAELEASRLETTTATEKGEQAVEQIQQQLATKEEEATKLATQVEQLTKQIQDASDEQTAPLILTDKALESRLETAKAALIGSRQILQDLDNVTDKQQAKVFKGNQANFAEVLAKIEEVLNAPAPKTTTPASTPTNTTSTSTSSMTGTT